MSTQIPLDFTESAVAFIDVLGFKSLVEESARCQSKRSTLKGLVGLLASAMPNLNQNVSSEVPVLAIPKFIYISDCIILSSPLDLSNDSWKRGMSAVVVRCIQLSHMLLTKGYLIRGGIAMGPVWHSNNPANIVGPAYQEAYCIESKRSDPGIELSRDAKSRLDCESGKDAHLSIDYGSKNIVNGLHDYYIRSPYCNHDCQTPDGSKKVYKEYQGTIADNISTLKDQPREKWKWFGRYMDNHLKCFPA